nr:MAG TPA: hypothetical protein [Caudoviricetes sp.]
MPHSIPHPVSRVPAEPEITSNGTVHVVLVRRTFVV